METVQTIKQFIARDLLSNADPETIDDRDPLIESGIIDSLGIMSLIAFIEKEFGVLISSNELMPETFENAAAIAALIDGKLGGGGNRR